MGKWREERKRIKKETKNERKKYSNSIEHRPREADSCRTGQKNSLHFIVHFIYYPFHSTLPFIPSLSLMNPVYTFPFYSLRSVLILYFHLLKKRKTISLKERIIVNACSWSYTLLLLLNGVQGYVCIWVKGWQSIFPTPCPVKAQDCSSSKSTCADVIPPTKTLTSACCIARATA